MNGDAVARDDRGRNFHTRFGALKARLGADEATALIVRASEALDLLGIDRKEGVYLALLGAERLAEEPGLSTAALAEELREAAQAAKGE